MRQHGLAALCLIGSLLTGCAAPPVPEASDAGDAGASFPARPIHRWVSVKAGVITLGEPLAPAIAIAGPKDTVVALPRGSFVGGERIVVHLAPGGIVRAVTHDYVLGADFEAMVGEYEMELGAARRSVERRPGEEAAEVAEWRDARTALRVVRDPNRSAWTVRVRLWDLAGLTTR